MDKVEFITKVYMKAFGIVMEETHNPNLAMQVAFSVTEIIVLDQRQKVNDNPAMEFLNGLFAKAAEEIKKKEEVTNGEEDVQTPQ